MASLFALTGALGLVGITAGVLVRDKMRQNILFVFGGVLLEAYSISIGDWVFIVLQVVFILAALYNLYKLR